MDRCAVFVDAGYLFAQGSAALTGKKKPRAELSLNAEAAMQALKAVVSQRAPECRLLRIYWYDGAIGGIRPTTDQAAVAGLDDVKLRLGFVNSAGQQKGVDSLIVTDLIELARLKSIGDAILLSGDEDVRIGVQIAQNYGVRVHLLGIEPSRGSQSQQLLHEADTTTEWTAISVASFLSVREDKTANIEAAVEITIKDHAPVDKAGPLVTIDYSVNAFVAELTDTDVQAISAYYETGARGVPTEFDRKLLPVCGKAIARSLEPHEKTHMRSRFQADIKSRLA